MPGKNVIKHYEPEHYYHVYNRGVAKQLTFLDDDDYRFFISLFKRYLSASPTKTPWRTDYPNYGERLELLTYCLMPNHFHLLIYQHDASVMTEFMRSVTTSYSMYFNSKHKRVGPVFQSRYRASQISSDEYLDHISRYIHLNPREWQTYEYSSLRYYLESDKADWINPEKILSLFPNTEQYLEFLRDYEGYKETLDEIHWELADQ